MALYESTFITRQDISRQDVQKLTDQFTSIIEDNGGKIVKNEYWGLRNLAYRIEKTRKGHYTMLGIDAPDAALKEMQRTMRITEEILRNLTIRVDELTDEPSVMMSSRNGRDEDEGDSRPRRRASANDDSDSDDSNDDSDKTTDEDKQD